MTPQQLLELLHDELIHSAKWGEPMPVPVLMHIKATLERELMDAISDDETPCPHNGTRWKNQDGQDRCGQCGRPLETEMEKS